MVAWQEVFDANFQAHYDARSDLRKNEKFNGKGFWGPSPDDLNQAVPGFLSGVKITHTPWDPKDADAGAIGQNHTFWVPNPQDKDYGIWGLAATANDQVKAAIAASSPVVYGYYARIAKTLPPIAKVADRDFQDGGLDQLYHYFPDQKPVVITTYEIVGQLNGVVVPLTDIIFNLGGDNYQLAQGASLAVTTDPNDTPFNLGGTPGAWSKLYGTTSPTQFGLDKDKAVLFWNGPAGKGQVLPAQILTAWFGPTWRGTVYQQTQQQ